MRSTLASFRHMQRSSPNNIHPQKSSCFIFPTTPTMNERAMPVCAEKTNTRNSSTTALFATKHRFELSLPNNDTADTPKTQARSSCASSRQKQRTRPKSMCTQRCCCNQEV
ncbi:unnamed protein product [Ectocarpus sp. 6 AP-2014]